jgi:type II secretory pathway component PulF
LQKATHRAVLEDVVAELEDGAPLTDALRRHPRSFDAVYCAIVAAGEASGSLVEMFERLSHIVQKRRALRKKILGAMAYPVLLIVMCVHILLVMLLFVLPRFNIMFVELHVDTPTSTRLLLSIGAALQAHWMALLSGAVGAGVALGFGLSRPAGRQWLADAQLYVPALGPLRSRLIQGQVFRTLGMLLDSGVGLLDSLDLVRRSTGNRRFQAMFEHLEKNVSSGRRMSSAFEQSGLVDASIAQAIHTGEESGQLGGAITFCADTLDETNEELITAVTRLIEPIILIGMGVVVGGVAISLFLPLFDMTSAMR